MPFLANIPQPGDKLKNSQGQLLGNNQQLDTSFGVDHYTFSNLTADNGKHNQVTTPEIVGGVHPTTAADEPKFYALEEADQIGVIQYSRGPSDAVPTPVTMLHSPGAVTVLQAASTNVFDFDTPTVIPRCMATLSAFGVPTSSARATFAYIFWNGTLLFVNTLFTGATQLVAGTSGSTLILTNSSGITLDVYWTLEFRRLQ